MCKERHLTTLHGLKVEKGNTSDKDKHEYNQNSEQDEKDTPSVKTFQCNSTYAGSDVVSLCVISIRVSHKQSIIAINTYALFNSFSQGTFVTEEVLKEMNLKGKGTTITVKTLNGEVTENSKVIEGLKVSNSSDFGQGIARWVSLPKSCTRKNIPLDNNDIIKSDIRIKSRVSFVARKT